MSEFQKLALERFSCRKFSDASVDNALIEKVLKIALAAPTAVNKQPFRIWVLSGDVAQRFAEHNPYHFRKKKLTKTNVKELLEGKETLVKGIKNKEKKPYNAVVKIGEKGYIDFISFSK